MEQHLLDVAEVLKIFRRRQLYAKSSMCEFGRQPEELGFLGHQLSKDGVSVDPRKVQSVVEWATPTSCTLHRGNPLYWACNLSCKLLPLLLGGIRRDGGAAHGAW